jgi:ankyrin repeat protein
VKYDAIDWNTALGCACRSGDISIIQLMIDNGADYWNYGFWIACNDGNMHVVQYMIDKGADGWNGGLGHACYSGNMSIIQLMIDKGANDWDYAFLQACAGGHVHIAKLMAPKIHKHTWTVGLDKAWEYNHIAIAKYILIERAVDPNKGLRIACKFSDIDLAKLMVLNGATNAKNCLYMKLPYDIRSYIESL